MEQLLQSILPGNGLLLLAQLLLATVLGGLVGIEREIHGRPAGLRTHILVCLGSALIIVAFEQLKAGLVLEGWDIIQMDPARVAAGIITGIGFLGAGTILKGKDHVMGLTTAASIWVVAAIGITTGLGQFFLAITATILVLFVLLILQRLDVRTEHYGEISLTGYGGEDFFNNSYTGLTGMGFRIRGYRIESAGSDKDIKVRFQVRYTRAASGADLIGKLMRMDGVRSVSWDNTPP